jgi:hypothetical protein
MRKSTSPLLRDQFSVEKANTCREGRNRRAQWEGNEMLSTGVDHRLQLRTRALWCTCEMSTGTCGQVLRHALNMRHEHFLLLGRL